MRRIFRINCLAGFLLLLMSFPDFIWAQDLALRKSLMDLSSDLKFVGSGSGVGAAGLEQRVKGSPYSDTAFHKGLLYVRTGEIYSDIPMRYNAYSDEVEVRLANGSIHLLSNREQIEKIGFNNKEMVYTAYSESGKTTTGFLTLLYAGTYRLYQRNYKVFREGTPSNGIVPETPPAIVDKPVQFVLGAGNNLPKVIQGKKDLLELSGENKALLEAYLKKEKPDIRSKEGLTAVCRYLDTP